MASDSINQVGKYIKKTRTDTDYALKKVRPYRPAVERTRDIFDVDVPFSMQFEVKPTQKSISMDLEFNKPPPMSDCFTDIDCPRGTCETFTLSAGEHEITLQSGIHPIDELLQVYVNGELWPESQYTKLAQGDSSSPGVILVANLPLDTNTVTICYLIWCLGELYTGQAFGAMLRSNDLTRTIGSSLTGWLDIGSQPQAGWYPEPDIGPIVTTQDGILLLEPMKVRIQAKARYAFVPGLCDYPDPLEEIGLPVCDCGRGVLLSMRVAYTGEIYISAPCGWNYYGGIAELDTIIYLPAGALVNGKLTIEYPPEVAGWDYSNAVINEVWLRVGRLRTHFPEGHLEGAYGYWDGADACTQDDCP